MPYLKQGEQLRLQALSKFAYRYPVTWVQDYVELAEQSIFTWWPEEQFRRSVFKVGGDCRMVPMIISKPSFDFFDVYTVLVDNDTLYGFK